MPRPSTGLNTASRKQPDGTTVYRWYHRGTGAFIGSSADGWTKDAAAERARDMDAGGKAGPPVGSFGELCQLYLSSPGYRELAPKTKRGYGKHIDLLRTMWETVPLIGINRKAVRALHGMYEDRPWQGNAILRTLRLLFNFGIYELELPGLVKNPVGRAKLYETAARTQVWDELRIEAFLGCATPRLRLAFALLLYTVQRPGDMLTLSRPMMTERDGRPWIRLRQAKTDELIDVPCHQRLADLLAQPAAPLPKPAKGNAATSMLLVSSPRGLSWSYRNFARSWDATRRLANWRLARTAIAGMGGLPGRNQPKLRAAAKEAVRSRLLGDLQRRDLRRTGVVQMALAGATVPQIAALAGWRIEYTQNIVNTYLPRRGEMALGGIKRWEENPEKVVVIGSRFQASSRSKKIVSRGE